MEAVPSPTMDRPENSSSPTPQTSKNYVGNGQKPGDSLNKFSSSSLQLSALQKLIGREEHMDYADHKIINSLTKDNLSETNIQDAALKYIRRWQLYSDSYPARIKNKVDTFEQLLRATAKLVFHGKYTKCVSLETKQQLRDKIQDCGFKVDDSPDVLLLCLNFCDVIIDPWSKLMGTKSITAEDINNNWKEGWIVLDERLEVLMSTKMFGQAANILEILITKGQCLLESAEGDTNESFNCFTHERLLQYMIIYVFLWSRNPDKYTSFRGWHSSMFREVVNYLLSSEEERKDSPRLYPQLKEWKKMNKIESQFLREAIWVQLKRPDADSETLTGLMNFLIQLDAVSEGDNPTDIPLVKSVLSRITEISSTAYLYVLADVIRKNKIGLNEEYVNAKVIEIYLRAMTIDMASIDTLKSVADVDKQKVREIQEKLSEKYEQLAKYFLTHYATWFQLILTAHCLRPQNHLYQNLFPQSNSECTCIKNIMASVPMAMDSAEELKLSVTIYEALGTVIQHPRWKSICSWTSSQELKALCGRFLETGVDSLIGEQKLEYLNIYSDKFKNLQPSNEHDDDDDGIEKGYGTTDKRKRRRLITITSLMNRKAKDSKMFKTRRKNNQPDRKENRNSFAKIKRNFIRKVPIKRTSIRKNKDGKFNINSNNARLLASRKKGKDESPVSASEGLNSTSGSLTLTMRVFDDTRKNYIIDKLSFQTDYERVQAFLQAHGQNLDAITAGASGYSADISSQENSNRGNRINFKSLGSTIPRESIVSIISDNPVQKRGTPSGRGRKRGASDVEPILASTKLDLSQSNGSSKIDGLTNGDDHSSGGESPLPPGRGKRGKKYPRVTPAIVGNSGKSDVEVTPSQRRSRGGPLKASSSSKKSTPSLLSSVGRPGKSVAVTAGEDGSSQISAKSPGVTPKGRPQMSILNISASSTSSGSSTKLTVTRESVGIGSSKGKTVEFDVEALSQSDLETLLKTSTLWGSMAIGEPVFARWRDQKYYSGVITQKGLNDTWHIAFEDDMKDVASERHIIPVSIMGVGVVGVYSPDGVYAPYPAKIVGHKFSAPKKDIVDRVEQAQSVIYAIECTDLETPIWCLRKQLSIEEKDAKELRRKFNPSSVVAKSADISYKNIIEGTRQRRSAATATQKIVGGAFDASSAEEGLMVGAGSSTPLRKMATPLQAPIKEDESETPSTSTSAKLTAAAESTSTANSQDIPSTATDSNTTNTKPTVRSRKQLFTGLEFFLTASGAGDPSCADEVVILYDRAELTDTLEKNGGKVIDSVSKESGKTNIYLISDSHARTVKYIYCLAGAIPCVSNDWIKKCIEANQLLDWHFFGLKAGFSLERESVIERHTNKPLKGMKIYVTAESEELYNYWKPVLTAAQAILLQPGKTLQNILETLSVPPEAEVLVTDATCAANVLSAANDIPIPIVRPEWLVQTIICGEKADFFGHERYRVPAVDNADEENDPPA